MKKKLALLLAFSMLATVFTGCGSSSESTSDDSTVSNEAQETTSGDKVVTIGVYEPASGDNGAGGKQETLGIQYANFVQPTVEIGGEEYQVKLEIVDNQSSNDKAISAASELISKKPSIILGSYGSGVSIAGSDTFKNAGVPALALTATNPQVTEDNDHYFRICFLDPFQGTILANYAYSELGATTAYTLAKQGDDYSTGLCFYFKKAFEALGGTVVSSEFPAETSDYASYITAAKNADAGVFFAPVSTESAALIVDSMATQGADMTIMAGDTWDSNVVTSASKGKDVDVLITTFYQEGGNEDFDAGIKEWMNSNSTALSNNGGNDMIAAVTAMGYDGYFVALEALKNAGTTDSKAVNEALWNVVYDGVCGEVRFDDEHGDAVRDVAYIKQANTETGEWDFVTVQKAQ